MLVVQCRYISYFFTGGTELINMAIHLDGSMVNETIFRFVIKIALWSCTNSTGNDDTPQPSVYHMHESFVDNVGNQISSLLDATKSLFSSDHGNGDQSCFNLMEFDVDFNIKLLWTFYIGTVLFMITVFSFISCKNRKPSFTAKPVVSGARDTELDIHKKYDNVLNNKPCALTMRRDQIDECKFMKYYPLDRYVTQQDYSEVGTFLQKTIDILYRKLDDALLERRSISPDTPGGTIVSNSDHVTLPRVTSRDTPSRRSWNRHRRSTSPGLPTVTQNEVNGVSAWQQFQCSLHDRTQPKYFSDVNKSVMKIEDRNVRYLLQFYKTNCALRYERWSSTCLIIDYVMFVLEKTCKSLHCSGNFISFQTFRMTGSVIKGLMSTSTDVVDYHMVFSPSNIEIDQICYEAQYSQIPPGKLILKTSLGKTNTKEKSSFLKEIRLDGEQCYVCSHQGVKEVAEKLIETAIQKLYTETRSLVDRLPFRIQRVNSASLVVSIDTRNTIGMHLPEIRINLMPSLALPVPGSLFYRSDVYAVQHRNTHDIKRKYPYRDSLPLETIWGISCGELENDYISGINSKMVSSGIHSCHRILISILKSLFSKSNKRSLLDKGEINSIVLEQIVCYMILESSATFWSFDELANRFSDSILFLKTALRHRRFPNFFVNNPHLIKEMPLLAMFPFLVKGRQDNIFSDIREEDFEKTFSYVERRIKECKLVTCLAEEYSDCMWEYEFFVFN